MQLYRWPTSPYVRKVTVLLLKAGIHDQIDKIFISPFENVNTPHDRNLFSKTRSLVVDAGAVLFVFSMICEYAERTHDELHLSKTWVAHQMFAVHRALASFEARDKITIGHISIAETLSNMDRPFSAKDRRHLTPVLPT